MTHSSDQCPNVSVIPGSSLLCYSIILLISTLWEDLERPRGRGREVWAAPRRQYGQNCCNILITGMGMPVDALSYSPGFRNEHWQEEALFTSYGSSLVFALKHHGDWHIIAESPMNLKTTKFFLCFKWLASSQWNGNCLMPLQGKT